MSTVMLFLHVVGAVGMGIYALLPFLVGLFRKISGAAQEGLASGLVAAGRIGQFALIVQLLTGGYMLTGLGNQYAVGWIVVTLVLFVAIGALSGIIQAPLRRIAAASKEGKDASDSINRVRTLSSLLFVVFMVILWLMQSPW